MSADQFELCVRVEGFWNDDFSFRRLIMLDQSRDDAGKGESGSVQGVNEFVLSACSSESHIHTPRLE